MRKEPSFWGILDLYGLGSTTGAVFNSYSTENLVHGGEERDGYD